MKKIVIPVVIFLLLLTAAIGFGIGRATNFMTHQRWCSDHLISVAQEEGLTIAEADDGERTSLTYVNVRAFLNAVTRTETSYAPFAFGLEEMPVATVTFSDGAVIEVFDAGEKNGDDLAYIRHSWRNKSKVFRITGYNTFERVDKTISLEGYNQKNSPAPAAE